ncbi:MAG: hypothetical protein E6Q34_04115 [Burkholderiaceae bacterium]|nr:MAG: hypothetical protein E6Q34_04115 [Burkholderiaceae bacterium]
MNDLVFFQKYPSRYSTPLCWLLFVVLLVLYMGVYLAYLPTPNATVGHDFSYLFPAWLDGEIWYRQNGLQIPWFTPSFCAGQPFFADPQSTFYSLPQFLVFFISPLDAVIVTLALSATLLFWGSYLLMRYVFLCHRNTALLVASVLMLNGFLPHRIIVGHVTFHGFALIPWIALLLLVPLRSRWQGFLVALAAGALLAYWVHSGFGSLALAGALTVFLLAIAAMLRRLSLQGPLQFGIVLQRTLVAGVFAAALAASKLMAGFAFLGQFPRTFYSLPGADSVLDELSLLFGALFLPSQQAYQLGMPNMRNLQWDLAPHEWAYNFSTVSALFLLFGALYMANKNKEKLSAALRSPKHLVLLLVLVVGCAIPLLLNFWSPSWNEFLKKIPIVNSMSTPLRWTLVWIPLIAVAMGLIHEHFQDKQRGALLTLALIAISGWQMQQEPREYYAAQNYSMIPVMLADQNLKRDAFKPAITQLGLDAAIQLGESTIPLRVNDTMVAGVSQIACYNPIFGYRLEKFSAQGLSVGPVMAKANGKLNLKNPACYVFPNENQCAVGEQFAIEQAEQAQKFVRYQPFEFAMSETQQRANLISLIALYFGAAAFCAWLLSLVLKPKRYAE